MAIRDNLTDYMTTVFGNFVIKVDDIAPNLKKFRNR